VIELAYPAALISLLAIPLLLLLYLLRPRRRRVVLSTIALWQAALRDREGAQGLRKLPRTLSLLLLLATVLLLGFALAGPQWLTRSDEGTDTVLVLDVSASMRACVGCRRLLGSGATTRCCASAWRASLGVVGSRYDARRTRGLGMDE
jgi:hypothetical protein